MPKATRRFPRMQAERLEQREVFSVGLDPAFGSGGFLNNFSDYGWLGHDAELFTTPGGSVRVGSIRSYPDGYSVQVMSAFSGSAWPLGITLRGEAISDFEVLPDGRVVTVSGPSNGTTGRPTGDDFYVRRFLANGSPDLAFGVNGKVEVDFSKPGDVRDDFPDTLLVTPDGDLLVYGRSAPAGTSLNNSDYALARLNPDGSLDNTLGGDGKVEFPRAGGYFAHMAVRADGKIVAAGNAVTGSGAEATTDLAVYRLNPDGGFDPTFGTGGKVTTDLGARRDWAHSLALTPSGGVIVAAELSDGSGLLDRGPAVLAWYGGAGNLIRTTTLAEGIRPMSVEVAPLSGGALVYGGTLVEGESSRAVVGKLNAAGQPDTAFAPGGALTLADGTDDNQLHDLIATPTGRVMVLGEGNSEYLAQLAEVGTVRNVPTYADTRSLWPAVQAGPDRVLEFPIGAKLGGYGTPTGTVTVTLHDDGNPVPRLTLGTVALGADGVARVTADLPEGTGTLWVRYSGDAVHAAGSWGTWVRFDRAATTTTLTASAAALQFGQPVTLTAAVAQQPLNISGHIVPARGPLGGTVTFRDGTSVLGTVPVGADGKATLSLPSMRFGYRQVTATYSGDAGNRGSSARPLSIAVLQAVSRVSLASSANPSAVGQAVTFRAAVRTDFGVPAIGQVTFKFNGTTIGVAPVNGAGVATITYTLPAGQHTISAEYSGSSTVQASVSPSLTQQVGAATPAATQTALTSSVASPVYGQPVALTATVTAAIGTPTGRVMFFDGTTALGTADVGAGGRAVLTTRLNPGYRQLRAVYLGTDGFLGSTSTVLKLTVGKAGTRVTVAATPTDPAPGQSVTLAVTVRPAYQGSPIGTVTVKLGDTVLGTAKLDGNGRATVALPAGLPAGRQVLRVEYGGSSTFLGSFAELTLDV